MATNKNITMKQFNGVDYDILYPKTIASQIDDVYSESETSKLFLPKAGGSMGGILDMNGNRITNLPVPASNSEPATKEYVENKFYSGTYTGNGQYGDEALTKITFNFSPNLVLLSGPSARSNHGIDCIILIRPCSQAESAGFTFSKVVWTDNSVSFANYVSANAQANYNGGIYYYYAISV